MVSWQIGVFALTGVLMASYLGTQAQAVGVGRYYGGLLGRSDRSVTDPCHRCYRPHYSSQFLRTWLAWLAAGTVWLLWAYHRNPAVHIRLGKGEVRNFKT